MKLQSRFFITISLLTAFILAFITFSMVAVNKRLLAKEADMRQETALETTVGIVREAYLTRDTILMVNYLKLVKQDHTEIGWLCITDSTGKVQASLDMNLLGMERSHIRLPENIRLLSRTVSSNAGTLGSVEVGFDMNIVETHLQASMFKIKKRIAIAGLWALVLGFIGSYLLALNLSGPIRVLSMAAGEIGKGNLEASLPTVKRRDELGDLSKAFLEMATHLKELDQMKQDFVSGTTHEFRSPLGIIESHATAVMQDLEAVKGIPENYRNDWLSSMSHIKSSSLRLNRFISDLLNMAKIERGKMNLNLQVVPLSGIIEETLLFFSPKAAEKKIDLLKDIPSHLPLVNADDDRIRQVLINLIGNALKFTPSGGKITAGARVQPQGWIYVNVVDTGPGIPGEFMSRIFSKFEQAKGLSPRAGERGTGLGLAICKGIVEGHGGEIGVKSQTGQGSEFYFTLPIH
ncbi:MAG: hypothetical protein A2270_02625 [Elusimicrobia bacterium RIFOXYA12_FULL_51_18]|nr:MAG: hypothetical protein A2270_02625 [Elusimicrobia bacterium RIFOXYA12_FULL_51_18]OGS31305.1 MAG: hypothetical protein A2218_08210 [Elusimicrobia bacterium RIFOXYA2_FULL_53_38]